MPVAGSTARLLASSSSVPATTVANSSRLAAGSIRATNACPQPGRVHPGSGISGLAEWLAGHTVEVVLVLGDRIEAFAAASAAAVAGVLVAHLHGGDRAPGIADEAMRHAITKLAHIHLPATPRSAQRIVAMGEEPARVHVVGSPAVDGLSEVPALADEAYDGDARVTSPSTR